MSSQRTRGEATRERILDAARALLVEEGVEGFVLRTIAGRVGITLGNLQYYFATRDDLLTAVIEAEFEQDLALIDETIAQHRDGTESLAAAALGLVEHWCSPGGGVFTTLWALAAHDDRFAALNEEIYRRFFGALAALLRTADRRADDDEVAMRTRLVTSVLDGVAIQFQAGVDLTDLTDRKGLADGGCDALFARATDVIVAIATTGFAGPRR